jgi:hypothetical protein
MRKNKLVADLKRNMSYFKINKKLVAGGTAAASNADSVQAIVKKLMFADWRQQVNPMWALVEVMVYQLE